MDADWTNFRRSVPVFDEFEQVTCSDIKNIISSLPNKICSLDCITTELMKRCSELVSPVICMIINLILCHASHVI